MSKQLCGLRGMGCIPANLDNIYTSAKDFKVKEDNNPQMLIWSRKTVKLSLELAAKKLGVKTAKLESWEKGAASPTVKQLYKIEVEPTDIAMNAVVTPEGVWNFEKLYS